MEWLPWAFALLSYVGAAAIVFLQRKDVNDSVKAISARCEESLKAKDAECARAIEENWKRSQEEVVLLRAHNTEMNRIVGSMKITRAMNAKRTVVQPPPQRNGAQTQAPAMTLFNDGPED